MLRILRAILLCTLFGSSAGLGGCAPGSSQMAPPEIRYGEDICAACNMIISDPRFAAGYAHEVAPGRYTSVAFDDIGEMLAHAADHPEHVVTAWYVHDYASEEWLDATTAFYVFAEALPTPMGQGLAAHATREAAAAMAQELNGMVMNWTELWTHAGAAGQSHTTGQ